MSRVRLTQRSRKAVDDSLQFPGNVNQPDRTNPPWEQYHTFEQTVNHELPDMRTEWKDNPRDEIGYGVPKINEVRAAATKAVKLAYMFLGDKVSENVIEAQARDFMKLGSVKLDNALKRYAKTETLYADQNAAPSPDADKKLEEQEDAQIQETAPEQAEAQKVVKSKKSEEVEAEDEEAPAPAKKSGEEETEDEAPEAEAKKSKKSEEEEETEDEDEGEEEEEAAPEAKKTKKATELDIEITAAAEEVEEVEEEDVNEELASLFAAEEEDAAEAQEVQKEVKVKAAKKGISRLGGQPTRIASAEGGHDLATIWADAPEISSVFNS